MICKALGRLLFRYSVFCWQKDSNTQEVKNAIELVVSRWDVSTAIELAEQDAEMRMREKAIKAYELGKRSVEEYPNSVTYNSLGFKPKNKVKNTF